MNSSYWRSLWLTLVGLMATALPALADMQTKIVSINGNYATTHDAYLTVYPGDTVSLSADQLDVDYYGNATPQNRYIEDFQWSSDANQNDICDPEYDCSYSNFDVNSYGVTFDVPYSMGQYITITVQNRTDGTYDQLTLVNGSYGAGYGSDYSNGGAYSDPYDYPENYDYDHNRALAGHGRWVYIHGERCFVPYSYQSDWRPYQHGRWIWTSYGWTWTSYDPWGYVTDHYGYWRHHGTYGWVWFPFPERRWYPAVVTWFHTDHGIGWYPYWSGYSRGYRHGYAHGYTDGYWDGYRAGLNASYNWGYSYVQYGHFTSVNIYHVRVTNVHVHQHYHQAYSGGRYGVVLRDHRYNHPRQFVEGRIGRRIEATPVQIVTRRAAGGGQVQWVRPGRVDIPSEYRQVRSHADTRVRQGARVPVGSVVRPDGRVERPSAPRVVRPNIPDRNGGTRPMPERSRVPVDRQRPTNPAPRPLPNRPAPSRPERPAPAPSRPDRPAPRPERPSYPAPRPERPAPTRPTQPAPRPERPSYPAPRPERPAPTRPTQPAPRPERPAPAPAPRPERPAPSRPTYPAPSRPSQPSRPAPAPRPERPSYPAPSRPSPAPSRPSYPAPSRPSQPSRPAPSRPSQPSRPAPSRPSEPSRPSKPSRPGPRPRTAAVTEVSYNVNSGVAHVIVKSIG